MRRLGYGAWLFLAPVIAGCVVPVPGSLEGVDFSKAPVPPLESSAEGIVVLATNMSDDEHPVVECVRTSLEREKLSLRIVSAREFRDALFPWLDLGTTPEELGPILSGPLVRKAVAELDVRYAIFVNEKTQGSSGPPKGSIQYLGSGVGWVPKDLTVSAVVWDVKRAQDMGSVRARASGSEGMIGTIVTPVLWVSDTEGAACRGLGERLGRVLTPGDR